MSLERLTASLTDTIVHLVDPDFVILFGSVAQERARTDSDVDFLVVGAFSGPVDRRGIEFRHAIAEIPVPVDAVFLTADEYASQAARPGSFVDTVTRHGRLMYVRAGFEGSWRGIGSEPG